MVGDVRDDILPHFHKTLERSPLLSVIELAPNM